MHKLPAGTKRTRIAEGKHWTASVAEPHAES